MTKSSSAKIIREIQASTDVHSLTAYLIDPDPLVRKQAKLRYKVLTNAEPEINIFKEQEYNPQDFIDAFDNLTQNPHYYDRPKRRR